MDPQQSSRLPKRREEEKKKKDNTHVGGVTIRAEARLPEVIKERVMDGHNTRRERSPNDYSRPSL